MAGTAWQGDAFKMGARRNPGIRHRVFLSRM
jgi:hypothetical protein